MTSATSPSGSTTTPPPAPQPASASDRIKDLLERAVWTAGQQFFTVLLATNPKSGFINLPYKVALATAAGAAFVSALTTLVLYIGDLSKKVSGNFWLDTCLRLAKTFIASLLATIGAMQFNVLTFDWSNALDIAVVATLTAAAKCFLAAGPGPSTRGESDQRNPSTVQTAAYRRIYGGG
jgi:r1t holin